MFCERSSGLPSPDETSIGLATPSAPGALVKITTIWLLPVTMPRVQTSSAVRHRKIGGGSGGCGCCWAPGGRLAAGGGRGRALAGGRTRRLALRERGEGEGGQSRSGEDKAHGHLLFIIATFYSLAGSGAEPGHGRPGEPAAAKLAFPGLAAHIGGGRLARDVSLANRVRSGRKQP